MISKRRKRRRNKKKRTDPFPWLTQLAKDAHRAWLKQRRFDRAEKKT
jgi:hypothetical protein